MNIIYLGRQDKIWYQISSIKEPFFTKIILSLFRKQLTYKATHPQNYRHHQNANCGLTVRHTGEGHNTTKWKSSKKRVLLPLRPLWEELQRPRRLLMPAWRRKADTVVVFPQRNVSTDLLHCSLRRNLTIRRNYILSNKTFRTMISDYLLSSNVENSNLEWSS